jgi:hypothetical protein
MSKTLTVGNETFEYPTQGTNPAWGEQTSDWAEAISETVATLRGPNDIVLTTAPILDNQSFPVDVNGLSFDTADVRSIDVSYIVNRSDGTLTFAEEGSMRGVYNGTGWDFAYKHTGDAGMYFSITAAGQVQYQSSSVGGIYTGSIKFKGSTIDN